MYVTKRLENPLATLKSIRCNKDTFFESTVRNNCQCVFESHISFKHKAINHCIDQMASVNSLEPLLKLAQEFGRFKFIQDEQFNKEFLLLVFGAYKNLLTHNAEHKNIQLKKSTLALITQLYQNLDSLPLEQILDTIDLLSEELPQILENYDIQTDMNWKQWLKKNWWVPPVVVATLGIKVFLIFKYTGFGSNNDSSFHRPINRPSQPRPNHGEYE